MVAQLTELRLPSFKSVKDAVIPITPLTLLVGRNGSGKSNALDGLMVLSALATGRDLRSALDGGAGGPVIRGGSEGCAPLGETCFSLGCSVNSEGCDYLYDVEIETSPTLRVGSERLWTTRQSVPLDLLRANWFTSDMQVSWNNQQPGPMPTIEIRPDQLAITQAATRIPATPAGLNVQRAAQSVLDAIGSVFMLEPEPRAMRSYVNENDFHLRRNSKNLSAVLKRLLADPASRHILLELTRRLSEAQVSDLGTVSTPLGDVMATIVERIGGQNRPVPASLMSDGTLRFLAMVSASLDFQTEPAANRLLVVEELEDGLHPSQTAILVEHLVTMSNQGLATVATTHSPVVLNSLPGAMHDSVIVATRDADGWSRFNRLTDFPNYFEVASRISLGEAAVRNELHPTAGDVRQTSLAELLDV